MKLRLVFTLFILLVAGLAGAGAGAGRTYRTDFARTENPLSEHGNWEGGKTVGLDWADVACAQGLAYGLEPGPTGYDDATALLTGEWGPDQTAEATVHYIRPNDRINEEVELRLRSALSPHRATGYEVLFSCSKTARSYTEIVRWNGLLGDFTYIDRHSGSSFGVADGDVVKATAKGNVITAYVNGVQVARAMDHTYPTGHPGIGFFIGQATGANRDYGFTRFKATDEP